MFSLSVNTLCTLPDAIKVDEGFILIDNTTTPHVTHLTNAWRDTPVQMEGILVIYCTSGEISVRIALENYVLKKDYVCIVTPGTVVEILSVTRDFHCMMLVMTSNFVTLSQGYAQQLLELFKCLQHKPCYALTGIAAERYESLFRDAFKTARWVDNPQRVHMIHSYVYLLYCCLYPVIKSEDKEFQQARSISNQKAIFFKFMELLQANYREHRTVQYYAECMNLTPKYLSKVVNMESGNTALALIENYVILEAKALLKQSNVNIQQVAEKLNFPNQNTFGKFFKRMVGVSPKEYRAN